MVIQAAAVMFSGRAFEDFCLELITNLQHQHVVPHVDANSSSSKALLNAGRSVSVATEAGLYLYHVVLQILIPHCYPAIKVTPALAGHLCLQADLI